jgi:hypothetical protein
MHLFLFFNTQAMHLKSFKKVFPKNLTPRRDSNPGLLFLRRMWCPLRHADRALVTFLQITTLEKNLCKKMLAAGWPEGFVKNGLKFSLRYFLYGAQWDRSPLC